MTKRLSIAIVAVLVLAAVALPASAGSWEEKVTGGGQALAGNTEFSITVSADSDGESSAGQMQYSRADLEVHATISCLGLFPDENVAVVAGPTKEQYDPGDFIGEGDWMVVEIKEGGIGAGDQVSVRLKGQDAAMANCNDPSGSYPGEIYDGNFNIRTKE